jgi:NAD(P)-dependent dehydrogenase (short-subunit alcohol dehydrogenase family)
MDLSLAKLEETAALIRKDGSDPTIELYEGTVTSAESVKSMIDLCVEVFGRIDIACNNAGIAAAPGRTHEVSMDSFDTTCAVNERGVSNLSRKRPHKVASGHDLLSRFSLANINRSSSARNTNSSKCSPNRPRTIINEAPSSTRLPSPATASFPRPPAMARQNTRWLP